MSGLRDEPLEKIMSEEKDMVEALILNEEVWGVVQCNNPDCVYWGRMTGYIESSDKKHIKFVCPTCNVVEIVTNPEYQA